MAVFREHSCRPGDSAAGRDDLAAARGRHLPDRVLYGNRPRGPAEDGADHVGLGAVHLENTVARGKPEADLDGAGARIGEGGANRTLDGGRIRNELVGLRWNPSHGDSGKARERFHSSRFCALFGFQKSGERALPLHDPGLPLLAAERPDAIEPERVNRVPLIHGARDHRAGAPGRERERRKEQRVQRGWVLLCDRDVRTEKLQLDRDLRSRRVGDRVGKVKGRRRFRRLLEENAKELREGARSRGARAHCDPDVLGRGCDVVPRFAHGFERGDDRVLASPVEPAGLHGWDFRLRAETVAPGHFPRLKTGALLRCHGTDRRLSGEEPAGELRGAAPEGADGPRSRNPAPVGQGRTSGVPRVPRKGAASDSSAPIPRALDRLEDAHMKGALRDPPTPAQAAS